jgi:hypothetical protein
VSARSDANFRQSTACPYFHLPTSDKAAKQVVLKCDPPKGTKITMNTKHHSSFNSSFIIQFIIHHSSFITPKIKVFHGTFHSYQTGFNQCLRQNRSAGIGKVFAESRV